ncbi:MAG: hypothetical protein R3D05_16790 [Dongiaceae bacterium]
MTRTLPALARALTALPNALAGLPDTLPALPVVFAFTKLYGEIDPDQS